MARKWKFDESTLHQCNNCGCTDFKIQKKGMSIFCTNCGTPKGHAAMLLGMK